MRAGERVLLQGVAGKADIIYMMAIFFFLRFECVPRALGLSSATQMDYT